jgi:hypothetical protein|tara:strand:- start:432 stop:644 length:213 start_codon:yes stop_codon:yes gene_type:complete
VVSTDCAADVAFLFIEQLLSALEFYILILLDVLLLDLLQNSRVLAIESVLSLVQVIAIYILNGRVSWKLN